MEEHSESETEPSIGEPGHAVYLERQSSKGSIGNTGTVLHVYYKELLCTRSREEE